MGAKGRNLGLPTEDPERKQVRREARQSLSDGLWALSQEPEQTRGGSGVVFPRSPPQQRLSPPGAQVARRPLSQSGACRVPMIRR